MAKKSEKKLDEVSMSTDVDMELANVPESKDEKKDIYVRGLGNLVGVPKVVNGQSLMEVVKDGCTYIVTEKSPGVYEL